MKFISGNLIFYTCFIGLFIILDSCTNPFKTRDVEEPDISDVSDIFNQPFTSEEVLNNFYYSIIQKNITNHMLCFIDPEVITDYVYRFIPDPSSEAIKFRDWTRNDEKVYLNTVFRQSSTISLEFLDDISYTNISQSPDSVQTNSFRYELKIKFEDREEVYRGTTRMKLLININGLWAIYYWEDIKAANLESQSWSHLKAAYKN